MFVDFFIKRPIFASVYAIAILLIGLIFSTLQTALGSQYLNDFNLQQRNYRVYIQADRQFRSNPKDIGKLYVRSQKNQIISLSNLVKVTSTVGAQTINHYNLFRSIEINGAAALGSSSGDAFFESA